MRRVRLLVLMTRPAVLFLLAMFAAIGQAQAGAGEQRSRLAVTLAAVIGFLLYSVAFNDLADEAIDRVNLPSRPLAAGLTWRRELVVIGATSGVAALAAAAVLGWRPLVVVVAGLVLSAGYSLRPVRLADRGAVASLVLPACYVAVPYLSGLLAVRATLRPADLFVLAGLYVAFIGRILLKDFRDLRGDALFGKRTFLVRHGRMWTCVASAVLMTAGTALLLAAARPGAGLTAAYTAGCGVTLVLLRRLATECHPHRDDALIGVIAVLGRGMLVALLAYLSATAAGWSAAGTDAVIAALAILTAGQARALLGSGPRPGRPGRPGRPAPPTRPGRPSRSSRPGQPGRPARPAQPGPAAAAGSSAASSGARPARTAAMRPPVRP
jgi:4-hydroxybenzoate polyprenyltransferase